jgi:hypothetical protein
MKIIYFAFLCASASTNQRGGLDLLHLHDRFTRSDLATLSLVIRCAIKDEYGRFSESFAPFSEFLFSLDVKPEAQDEIKTYSKTLLVDDKLFAIPIGQYLGEPGAYTLTVRADGILQHRLDLFLE